MSVKDEIEAKREEDRNRRAWIAFGRHVRDVRDRGDAFCDCDLCKKTQVWGPPPYIDLSRQ